MVIEWLVSGALAILASLFAAVLPTSGPPDVPDITGVVHLYGWLDSFLPVTETLTAMGLAVGLLVLMTNVRVFQFAWRHVPIIGSR